MEYILVLLAQIAQTPLPKILVLGGILFLFLGIVGKFGARIVVSPQKQRQAAFFGTILLVGGIALYIVGAPSTFKNIYKLKDERTLTPPAALTREVLVTSNWRFLHGEGDVISPSVKLKSNGSIIGINHPNESSWGLEDGTLVFYHASGVPSTRFDSVRLEHGKFILSGRLLLEPMQVVIHVLEQL